MAHGQNLGIPVLYQNRIPEDKLRLLDDVPVVPFADILLYPGLPVLIIVKYALKDLKRLQNTQIIDLDTVSIFALIDDIILFRIDMHTVRCISQPRAAQNRPGILMNLRPDIHKRRQTVGDHPHT